MTDSGKRYIGVDVRKHYLIALGVDEDLNVVLPARRVEFSYLEIWMKKTLTRQEAVVLETSALAAHESAGVRDTVKPNRPAWQQEERSPRPAFDPGSGSAFRPGIFVALGYTGTQPQKRRERVRQAKGYRPAPRKHFDVVFKTKKAQHQPKTC